MSNKRIGETLYISESTVKFHIRNIIRKLGVSKRTDAVCIASKPRVDPDSGRGQHQPAAVVGEHLRTSVGDALGPSAQIVLGESQPMTEVRARDFLERHGDD